MKTLILSALVLMSTAAVAGPEEHIQLQTCYIPSTEVPASLKGVLPVEVCLETLNIDTNKNEISIYSYFQPNLYKGMQILSLIRNTEDTFKFSAANTIATGTSNCEGWANTTLYISGETDFTGLGDITELNVRVKNEVEHNGCNQYPLSQTVQYVKRY